MNTKRSYLFAVAGCLVGLLLGACIFKKNNAGASPLQLLQLLAQTASCWVSAGNTATTACNVTISGRISSSMLGVYCGKTTATYNGAQVGGYAGAKAKCEVACGNANAHMCTGHEVSISQQLGVNIPSTTPMWLSTYVRAESVTGTNAVLSDCEGWASNNIAYAAPRTATGSVYPSLGTCDISSPIACCL